MVRKFKISVNGKDYDVEVAEVLENKPEIKKTEPEAIKKVEAPVAEQKAKEYSTPPDSQAGGAIKITAPMPGTILKINFEKGQSVKKGQVVLILEAMKMENEITAPIDGVIACLNVPVGSRVNSGEVMVTLE